MDKSIEMTLKRKYRIGKMYTSHSAKPRTGPKWPRTMASYLHEAWKRVRGNE